MDRTLLKNTLSLLSIQAANYLFPLITLPYVVRVLGPENYGRVGFAVSFVQYFVLLTDFGFNLSATRSIATARGRKGDVSRIFWAVMSAKAMLCVIGAIALIVLSAAIPKLGADRGLLFASYLSVVGSVLFPLWLFQGLEKLGLATTYSLVGRAISVPLIFLFVRSASDALAVAAIQSGVFIVSGVVSLALVWQQSLVSWTKPALADIREAMRESWPLFLSVAAISLYTTSNVVILGFVAGNLAVGQFVAVDKLRQAAQGLITPLSQAAYPRVCSLMAQSPPKAFAFIHRLLLGQGAATLVISLLLALFAGPIVALALGARYLGAIPTLRLLAFLPFAIGLSNVFGIQTLLPLGMQRSFRNIVTGSGILNLALLVPLSVAWADKGAAAAMLITEIVVTLAMALVLVRRRIPIFASAREIAVEA
ncbi:MAG: flippase [Rhizomicrobium sp.]|jgi:O-antigen/teichoic acid export membrane protein